MRQPFVAVLAAVTIISMLFVGAVLIRSWPSGVDEYNEFHRNPVHVITNNHTKVNDELDAMWEATGWLAAEVAHSGETFHAYIETVWAVGRDATYTYFVTCYHGIRHAGGGKLTVGYWHSNKWHFVYADIVEQMGYMDGDVALVKVLNNDLLHQICPLKIAKKQTFVAGDEVLIGGVQPSGGPAFVCIGTVNMVNIYRPEFVVKGWAWYGFSGGPVRLRRTNEVIGFVRSATSSHPMDASESICGDFNLLQTLMKRAGLEHLVK